MIKIHNNYMGQKHVIIINNTHIMQLVFQLIGHFQHRTLNNMNFQ